MSSIAGQVCGRAGAVVVLVLSWAGLADAQLAPDAPAGSSDAEFFLRRGVEQRHAGHDAEALELFRSAYVRHASARARGQIGLAEEALGDWLAASEDLRGARGEPDDAGWLAKNDAALDDALKTVRSHIASLVIETNVPNAEVWVRGKKRASLPSPAPVEVLPGESEIEVRADGFEPIVETVSAPAGVAIRQMVTLRRVPVACAAVASDPSLSSIALGAGSPAAGVPVAAREPLLALSARVLPVSDRTGRLTLAWSLAGVSAAFLAGATVAEAIGRSSADVYNDDSRCLYGELTRDERCGSWRTRAEVGRALAVAGVSIAGVAAVGSVVLFAWRGRERKEERGEATLRCQLSFRSVGCEGTY